MSLQTSIKWLTMLQDRIFFFIWDLLFRNLGFQSKVDPTPCFEQEVGSTLSKFFLQRNIRNHTYCGCII